MKRLAKLPYDRFIFPASELMPEPQPLFDTCMVQQNEPVRIEHVEHPSEAPKLRNNLHAELMKSVSRIVGGIALVLVAATIISQLTKRPDPIPVVSEEVAVARTQWGAR